MTFTRRAQTVVVGIRLRPHRSWLAQFRRCTVLVLVIVIVRKTLPMDVFESL
jgi:hypothetical protein